LTAVGATTGGAAAGASSVVVGGVAAKVAAVFVAAAVVGGGTYEGVRVVHPTARNAQAPAARVEFAAVKSPGTARGSGALTFETPKFAAPILVEPSPRATVRALRAVRAHRPQVVPPGQTVKALVHTSTLQSTPPGLAVKATRAATPASAHSQASTAQSRRRTPSHPPSRATPKSARPTLPVVPHGRQTPP
jgi:hypothetical protein